MTRIWLNHWFSTAYNIIGLIRQGETEFQIIGSNAHPESPIKTVCDEWYQEPVLQGEAYVDFCVEFCSKHHIDVFMPRREMVAVSKYKDRFSAIGVKVMADDYKYVSPLSHKDRAYELFCANEIGNIPDFYIVRTVQQFETAYNSLREKYRQVCFKFAKDEGGKSYRLIDNGQKGYASLFKKQTTRISLADAMNALSDKENFAPIMVMPYLPGDEISVDCLATAGGLIAVPRVKNASRVEMVRYDDEILDTCRILFEKIPLEQPCNIQFKYLNGVPYLLEVNTRMSGGIQMSCAVSGINIPNIAVRKLLGMDHPWVSSRAEGAVTHIEVPIVL